MSFFPPRSHQTLLDDIALHLRREAVRAECSILFDAAKKQWLADGSFTSQAAQDFEAAKVQIRGMWNAIENEVAEYKRTRDQQAEEVQEKA